MATAVDDRDNDVPVVLSSFGFCRSHHLLRLFERNRWTVVTNSLVNGHFVLPSVAQTSDLPVNEYTPESAHQVQMKKQASPTSCIGLALPTPPPPSRPL